MNRDLRHARHQIEDFIDRQAPVTYRQFRLGRYTLIVECNATRAEFCIWLAVLTAAAIAAALFVAAHLGRGYGLAASAVFAALAVASLIPMFRSLK